MTSIRCSRRGRKRRPFYNIIVADSRTKRDGKFIEKLGYYDPIRKEAVIRMQRFMFWFKLGAVASNTVLKIVQSNQVHCRYG